MPERIDVRPLADRDFEEAVYLVERFFHEEGFNATSARIRTELQFLMFGEDSAVFLAGLGGQAVGVATVTTTRGIELGLSAELEDLYVLPEARGAGVGDALIDAVKSWCRARGCTLVAVVVTPEGQAAHDLVGYYARQGFAQTGRTLLFAHLQQDGSAEIASP
ncbi:MAG: GNAT family N-acetyltransferase [Anaerolineae bacterium]|jgi:aminoglycoside 6'-N-acetyltransferase I